MAKKAKELDCRKCGACCSPQVYGYSMREQTNGYVQLLGLDLNLLSDEYLRRHVRNAKKDLRLACKKNHNGCVCVALRGTVGKRVSCGIYARRPHACRIFEKGSENCLATIEEMAARRRKRG